MLNKIIKIKEFLKENQDKLPAELTEKLNSLALENILPEDLERIEKFLIKKLAIREELIQLHNSAVKYDKEHELLKQDVLRLGREIALLHEQTFDFTQILWSTIKPFIIKIEH